MKLCITQIPMQDVSDAGTRRLTELLGSFDLVQHVNGPTHRHGNTLDLVITPPHFVPAGVDVEPAGMLSDHAHRLSAFTGSRAGRYGREIGAWLASCRPV